MKKWMAAILALTTAAGLTACSSAPEEERPATKQIFAMDTVMQVSAYGADGDAVLSEVEEELYDLDGLLSRTREGSQVSALNEGEGTPIAVDARLGELLEAAEFCSEKTGGAFDITIAPVADAWGFTTETHQVPDAAALADAMSRTGMNHVRLEQNLAVVDAGAEIDLGGIAKGYASDRVAQIYSDHAVPRGLVSLGGNVLAWGDKPDGSPWRVGIQDPKRPDDPEGLAGVVQLKDSFAITSGGYQRFFEEDGIRYHHIIDPATGYPADSGLVSVTVVAPVDMGAKIGNGTICDAFSTALFVMGEEQALDFWRSSGMNFQLILMTEDDRLLVTEGLAEQFSLFEESGYHYETVS